MTVIAFKLPQIVQDNDAPSDTHELWLSAQEIADRRLPGLPKNKRKINELASRERWAFRTTADGAALARTRKGRGGGIEYNTQLLPAAARAALFKVDASPLKAPEIAPAKVKESIWSWFDQQTQTTKDKAKQRLAIVQAVCRHEAAGMNRSAAVPMVAAHYGKSAASIWNWLRDIAGIAEADWLPHLASRHAGGGKERDVDADIWSILISDYLRPEKPTWESCYWRAKRLAETRDIEIPSSRTLFRKFERDIDPLVVVKRREGRDAHALTMPAQIRTVAGLHAMEIVNIDGHRWDVFVRWPDGKIARPIMVAIQDIYSRKVLAWRIDETENAVLTRLAFADLFRDYGIPKACLLDNGRAFASKWITGGAKTRFRFKIKPDDPTGLLPALGINPKWATPYHGQAKPIERAFRDMCDAIARCPEFAGAYTGGNPMAKPENYGSKAVDLDTFLAVINREIPALNAKMGRRTEMAKGRSFDDAFNESYAAAPIGKATPEQLRLALLTADDKLRTHRKDGSVTVAGNKYWSPEMSAFAGEQVTVRFDPDNLHSEVHVYTRTGRFIATVPVWSAEGFADMGAANRIKKRRADHRKATAKAEEALNLLSAAEIAAQQPAFDAPDLPEPAVVRPVRHRGNTAAALKPAHTPSNRPEEAAKTSVIDRFAAITERHLKAVD
ncbi:MAG: transposase domain-containing protein [Sphingorhabdus sp.]